LTTVSKRGQGCLEVRGHGTRGCAIKRRKRPFFAVPGCGVAFALLPVRDGRRSEAHRDRRKRRSVMRKDAKRASKSTEAKKKADLKDLAVKNPATVKGGNGKVSVNDISFTKYADKSSASLL
jgi:hypothetical protein